MDKKKILISCFILIILASIGISIYIVTKKEKEPEFTIDGIGLPENKDILKDATVGELKVTNASIVIRENTSTYTATVSNNTNKSIDINQLYIVFYEGELKTNSIALYNTTINANEEKRISITTEKDLTNITKIEYVLK